MGCPPGRVRSAGPGLWRAPVWRCPVPADHRAMHRRRGGPDADWSLGRSRAPADRHRGGQYPQGLCSLGQFTAPSRWAAR